MDILKDYPSKIEIGSSTETLQKAMASQQQIFHTQIDQLRNIVVTQCKLTGVNPLSQEMAAGALDINIGKRPRDLLNPKALRYMQAVFSIKDAISKKESREIGALFGLTVTQVREYFAGQRSRVRKMVRLSREKAIRTSIDKELQDGVSTDSDLMLPIDPTPLSSISNAEEDPSCSNQDKVLPGLGEFERHFVENIFSSMCKEETFSGQVNLLEWILQIENPSILCWFLMKGSVMILATWLSQAANEEQTSVISSVLKVLCHLPLNKALPAHMSAILQGVNKLRFYRIPDISNRARVLLSKWSKMFVKSQALKKPNGTRVAGAPQQEFDLTRRIGELVGDDSWQSSVENADGMLVPFFVEPDDTRKVESSEAVKLLTASSDESNKKLILGTSTAHNKERRQVQLVEQPGQKASSKSQPVKAGLANQRRPITADEIQKAKMRAQYMQSSKIKTEGPKKHSLPANDLLSASEAYLRPKLEAQKKARLLTPPKKQVDSASDPNPVLDQKETLLEKCRRVQVPWWAPPEIQLTTEVSSGESSKELEVQRNRAHREKETIYRMLQEVPPNPKEPWDSEMDYDDSLTPEIPIEQLPDADSTDVPVSETQNPDPSTSSSQAEPDLELLAVLLKNPELVFALTSGQASGLSGEDTVKLLDLLKSNGGAGLLSGQAVGKSEGVKVEASLPSPTPTRNVEVSLPSPTPPSRFEVSLPSPTPSNNPRPSGWTATQTAKNPFTRQTVAVLDTMTAVQDTMTAVPVNSTAVITSDRLQNSCSLQPHHHPSQTQVSARMPPENHATYFAPGPTLNSPYSRPTPALPRSQMHSHTQPPHHHLSSEQFHPIPEDINLGMVKARHGLSHNLPFANQVSHQNVYNPAMLGGPPGSTWERNDYRMGRGHKGYESWSPDKSPGPARYPPEHHHGPGWSYPDQRGAGYGPIDRFNNRHQNFHGGGSSGGGRGGVNRRWNSGDRRR